MMKFTKESLYEYVLRCKFLGQDAIYNDYKLDISHDKLCVVGLSSDFIYTSNLVIDGSLFDLDLAPFMSEIYNLDTFRSLPLNLTIINLKVLTKDFFCVSSLKQVFQLDSIILLDTIEIKKHSFFNIECNNLYAHQLLKIEHCAFFSSIKFKSIIAPKCESLSFSDLRNLRNLSVLKISNNYSLEVATVYDWTESNYNIYKILKADDFEVLNFNILIFYLYKQESCDMYFKKLKILFNSPEDNDIYIKYRKQYFPVYNKKVIFSSLEILQIQFYHMQFSDSVEFPVLKTLHSKRFNCCIFNTLSLNDCERIYSCSFNSCKINVLELSNMSSLSKGYFKNCSINKLIINKNCKINEAEFIGIATEIVRL